MLEYLPLWELFFKRLGFTTCVSSEKGSRITAGREIMGADFCAPIADFHGHIRDLASEADYIFYPQLFKNANGNEEKAYCYYSQYAESMIRNIPGIDLSSAMIAPILNLHKNVDETIRTLYLHLPDAIKKRTSFARVEEAFLLAWDWFRERKADLQDLFRDQAGASNDIGVVLLGRPYLILNPALNKGIPDKLAEMGIQSFYMDMIPVADETLDAALDFIRLNHWHYGMIPGLKRLSRHFVSSGAHRWDMDCLIDVLSIALDDPKEYPDHNSSCYLALKDLSERLKSEYDRNFKE